jgi:hypothetical protein
MAIGGRAQQRLTEAAYRHGPRPHQDHPEAGASGERKAGRAIGVCQRNSRPPSSSGFGSEPILKVLPGTAAREAKRFGQVQTADP